MTKAAKAKSVKNAKTSRPDPVAWLWPAFAAVEHAVQLLDAPGVEGKGVHAGTLDASKAGWEDARIGNAVRALAVRQIGGTKALLSWPEDVDELPPRPVWWRGWRDLYRRLEDSINAYRPSAKRLRECNRATLYLYHLQISTLPTDLLTQVQRGRAKASVALGQNIERLGQLDDIHVFVRLGKRGGAPEIIVNDGRRRTTAIRAKNIEEIEMWWSVDVFRTGVAKASPPSLKLRVDVKIDHVSEGEAVEISSALNAQRRGLSRVEQIEDVLRMRRPTKDRPTGMSYEDIAEVLGCSKSTVINLGAFERLARELLPELFAGTLPLACGYELVRYDPVRQVKLWADAKGAPNKLERLRQLVGGEARTGEPAPARVRRVLKLPAHLVSARASLEGLETVEARLARDLLDALHGDQAALERLPEDLRRAVGTDQTLTKPKALPGTDLAGEDLPTDWTTAGFSTEEAKAWEAANIFDVDVVSDLREAGFTPEEMSRTATVESKGKTYTDTLYGLFVVGVLSVDDIVVRVKEPGLLDAATLAKGRAEAARAFSDGPPRPPKRERGRGRAKKRDEITKPCDRCGKRVAIFHGSSSAAKGGGVLVSHFDDERLCTGLWAGFELADQKAWEEAGVEDGPTAQRLQEGGLSPQQCKRVANMPGKPRNSLGTLYQYGSLTLEQVQLAAVAPKAEEATGAAL